MRIETKEELKRVLELEGKIYPYKWYYHLPIILHEKQFLAKHARLLRKAEYTMNTGKITRYWYYIRLLRLHMKAGMIIPLNVLGEGYYIPHMTCVMISSHAQVGKGATFMPGGCTIGTHHDKAPIIGDNVYIGPGARIFGGITLADRVHVGANAVVGKSCEIEGAVLAGSPAKVVRVLAPGENIND